MSEMIERIARALNPKAWLAVDEARKEALSKGWDPILATRHLCAGVDQSILMARTALEAMREPTPSMLSVAERGPKTVVQGCHADIAWTSMVDEALK
jgi:hypothetical protein